MAAPTRPNLSDDLLWEITRKQNAFIVKRTSGGGAQFSRDSLNLLNRHSRKYSGFATATAMGVQASGDKGALTVTTKAPRKWNKPASNLAEDTISATTSNRKAYKGIANRAVDNISRPDLREDAVARASAIRKSQRSKKNNPEPKLRGAKARKAAEKEA